MFVLFLKGIMYTWEYMYIFLKYNVYIILSVILLNDEVFCKTSDCFAE